MLTYELNCNDDTQLHVDTTVESRGAQELLDKPSVPPRLY